MDGAGEGRYLRGDFADIRADTVPWGNLEGLPDFLRVTVTDAQPTDFGLSGDEWHQNFDWDQIATDPTVDGHRYQLWTVNRSASGLGDISLAQVQNYLGRWNATNIISQPHGAAAGVRFDVKIYDAAISEGFWERETANFSFTELVYDQGTATHDIRVVHPPGVDHDVAVREVGERATVIADDEALRQVDFRLTRAQVLARMKLEIKAKMQRMIKRRQLYLSSAAVNQIIGLGGSTSVSATQLQNNMRDRITE